MLIFSVLLTLLGVGFVAMYILEAIVHRMGEPDQSLIYWYLPILFIGLIATVMGFRMGAWSLTRLRKLRRPKTD